MIPTASLRDTALSFGLKTSEYDLILELFEREPSLAELGMVSVMWSEHCGYKYSRPILAHFKRYKEALEAGGMENAGVIPLNAEFGITFKVESHNHPSAVEPYQGAATGVGGILRDIFTMGARPIACLNSLRFGPIEPEPGVPAAVAARNAFLFEHVVSGIGGYGNCVGVPTVGGEVAFHPRYSGNPLVNAMAVGLVKMSELTTAAAIGIGNPVIYLGSATGKDGIHGASFASTGLDEESADKRPNVQIGDPFAEKLLIEATLEALATGAIVSIQDMGAAGLTCSTIEMSARGGVGMTINLDLVPMRESDMSAYELLLSESQERMMCVATRGREHEVIDVFRKWGLHAVEVGQVTEEPRVKMWRHGKLEADVFAPYLADQCPTYTTEREVPAYFEEAKRFELTEIPDAEPNAALLKLLRAPTVASKQWVYRQYDSEVQTQTLAGPGEADAAVLGFRAFPQGISLCVDGNGLWTYFDPYVGGQLAVAEAARNVACTGARPSGLTDGLNFGNPQLGHVYWQFDECVRGIAEAAEAMATPVVSGNVSFYNESELGEVLPTPIIGMLGILPHAESRGKLTEIQAGNRLGLLWIPSKSNRQEGLGASQYLRVVHGIENGCPVAPHLDKERELCELLVELFAAKTISAAHDISEGGLVVCVAEMALAGNIGAQLEVPEEAFSFATRRDAILFGEVPGFVLVAFDATKQEGLEQLSRRFGIEFASVGTFNSDCVCVSLKGDACVNVELSALRTAYEGLTGSG